MNRFFRLTLGCFVALLLGDFLLAPTHCLAQGAPAAKPAATDSKPEVADELGNELLRDIPPAEIKPAGIGAAGRPSPKPPVKPSVAPPAGEDISAGKENIARELAGRMRRVGERLRDHDLSPGTISAQKEILAELDRQLAAGAAGPGSPSKQPGQTATGKKPAAAGAGDSSANPQAAPSPKGSDTASGSPPDKPEVAQPRSPTLTISDAMRHSWGHLPAKVLEQMQSSLSEKFLPKYEKLTEEYYRRLAEEPAGR